MTADDAAPEVPAPLLKLAGREFRCVPHVPTWAVMRLAAGYTSGQSMRTYAAMYEFLKVALLSDEWSGFEEHASSINATATQLDEAIGDLLVEMGGRGKATAAPVGRSSDGSPTPATSPISRVVSLSRGTVEVKEPGLSDAATSSTG
jgi:hypothetical protein